MSNLRRFNTSLPACGINTHPLSRYIKTSKPPLIPSSTKPLTYHLIPASRNGQTKTLTRTNAALPHHAHAPAHAPASNVLHTRLPRLLGSCHDFLPLFSSRRGTADLFVSLVLVARFASRLGYTHRSGNGGAFEVGDR